MRLSTILNDLTRSLRAQAGPQALAVVEAGITELQESHPADRALVVGGRVPLFSLPDHTGIIRHFGTYLERGPVALSFFRGGWCPYCQAELRALVAIHPMIREHGAEIVAVTPQTPAQVGPLCTHFAIDFPVLSDISNDVARRLGLVYQMSAPVREVYERDFHIELPCYNGDRRYELPIPATYIIDRDGVVHAAFVEPDYTRRMEPEDILRVLEHLHGAEARG